MAIVTLCFVKKENKILMINRNKPPFMGMWNALGGHKEENESALECAIRETAEETKRVARVIDKYPPYIEKYTTPSGEMCECYWYLAEDMGVSDNDSTDTHEVMWVDIENIENSLSYPSLKKLWIKMKEYVLDELTQS